MQASPAGEEAEEEHRSRTLPWEVVQDHVQHQLVCDSLNCGGYGTSMIESVFETAVFLGSSFS